MHEPLLTDDPASSPLTPHLSVDIGIVEAGVVRVLGATGVDHARDVRPVDGAQAHRAGLARAVDRASLQNVRPEVLGRRRFGHIAGLLAIPFMGGAAIAPTLAALLWEVGGYDLVIGMSVVMVTAGLGAAFLAARVR